MQAQQGLAEIEALEAFPARAVGLLRQLIAADHAGYNAIDLANGRATVVADPPDSVFDGGPALLAQLGHQNPMIVHNVTRPDGRAHRLSEFISRRDLHRTDLYDQIYRHIGLEFQLAVTLPPPRPTLGTPPELIGLSFARRRRDFTATDHCLLEMVRPAAAATLERLHDLALARAILTASPAGDAAMALVDGDGAVAWASPAAAERGVVVGERLAASLATVAAGAGRVTVTLLGERVTATRTPDAYPGLDALHLAPACPAPDRRALEATGLTARQAEVLALAAEGRTTLEIAAALGLAPRSVEKHFERIYARLGVRSRTQAILLARGHA